MWVKSSAIAEEQLRYETSGASAQNREEEDHR